MPTLHSVILIKKKYIYTRTYVWPQPQVLDHKSMQTCLFVRFGKKKQAAKVWYFGFWSHLYIFLISQPCKILNLKKLENKPKCRNVSPLALFGNPNHVKNFIYTCIHVVSNLYRQTANIFFRSLKCPFLSLISWSLSSLILKNLVVSLDLDHVSVHYLAFK